MGLDFIAFHLTNNFQATQLELNMELVIAMPNVHMMSNSLTARPIPSIGLLQRQILIREVESMGLAAQKWISGKPIRDLKPLLPILALYPDYSDVTALIVVIMTREIGKGPLINYDVSKSAIFDPSPWPPPSLSPFYCVKSAILNPSSLLQRRHSLWMAPKSLEIKIL